MITLYDYFRSSAAYRVRIVLNLKGLDYQLQEVHLVNNGGEQHQESYQAINPQELVPTLIDDDFVISQSMAIIEYLEKKYPEVSVFTGDIKQDARIRALANIIACDIHPLNNLRVLQYLKGTLNISDDEKTKWYANWIALGFAAFEKQLDSDGKYCFGDQITLADICLIPQVYNAYRFHCDMSAFKKINNIYQSCMKLDAFQKAASADWPNIIPAHTAIRS